MGVITGDVRDEFNAPIAGAAVYVYTVDTTTPVQLYSDRDLTVTRANPVTTGSAGEYHCYAADGIVDLKFTAAGHPDVVVPDLPVVDPRSYALLAGRPGGQTLTFATGSAENGKLCSTSHATKGKILFGIAGASAYDEANNRLGVGSASPLTRAHVHAGASTTPAGELGGLLVTGSTTAKRVAIGYDDSLNVGWIDVVENGISPRTLYLNRGPVRLSSDLTFTEQAGTPSAPAAGSEAKVYVKGDNLVVQFNDGGTVRYKYLLLSGVSATWVHSTTTP